MGKRGPKPTPTHLLRLAGSRRAGRNRKEPDLAAVAAAGMKAPSWLDAEGKACWKRTVVALEEMGVLSKAYRDVIAGLCQNWSLFVKTSRMLNKLKEGGSIMEAKRMASTNAEAYRNYVTTSDRLGLSPSAKARIEVPDRKDSQADGKGRFFNSAAG